MRMSLPEPFVPQGIEIQPPISEVKMPDAQDPDNSRDSEEFEPVA